MSAQPVMKFSATIGLENQVSAPELWKAAR
jgi:hypothetical protein